MRARARRGVSARPRRPRRAPAGPNSPPLRDVPASGAALPTGLHVQNHRCAGHARRCQSSHPIFLQQIDQKLPQASTSRPHCCRTPGRGRLTRHSCATPANAPQNDPDLVTQHQQQPRAAKKRPETMNKFGAQSLGRSFLSLLFAGDDDRRLGRATTIDLEAVLAVSRRTWPQHLAAYH